MLSSIKLFLDKAANYFIAIFVLSFASVIIALKYALKQVAELKHDNLILKRQEEIRAEQKINEAEILENEQGRIKRNVEKFKTVNKTKRARLRNL